MNSLALYVIFLSVGFVENQGIHHMLYRGRHNTNHRHIVAYPGPSGPVKDSKEPAPGHSHLVKHISAASPAPPDPVKHTSVASPAPPDPVKHSKVAAPVHSHPLKHNGGAAPVHSHPVKHTSVASPAPPDPVKHSRVAASVHSHPLTHSGGAAPVHSHPVIHTSVASPAPPDPVKHSSVAASVHSHPLTHSGVATPVHSPPLIHSGGAAPVHSSPQNGKAVFHKTYTTPPKPKPRKPQAPPKPKYLINRQYNTRRRNPRPVSAQPVHHQNANLPAVLEAVDHLSYFQDRSLPDSFGLLTEEKFFILKEFNQFRQDCDLTRNMNVLRWNETLAERAAAEINSCLYFNKGNGAIYAMIYEKYTGTSLISEAVGRWADEKNKFRLSTPCNDVKSCRYSQIVWANTREVGCARQTCNDMSMVACMYDPPGNVIGEQAYKPGRACSRCAPGSRCNTDNLCEW